MDQRENIINIVKNYKAIVQKDFPIEIKQFYLFGSYAKGTQRKDSDIDVALIVDHLEEDYDFFKMEPLLWLLKTKVDYRIEPHLIARDTDESEILQEIERTGIEIAV